MNQTDLGQRPLVASAVLEWNNGEICARNDSLAGEEPLLIRVGGQPLTVTMRTAGDDFELAAGFLFTEGIVCSREEIAELRWADDSDAGHPVVHVELRGGLAPQFREGKRNFLANSSCGLCGKTSLESVYTPGIVRPNPDFRMDPQVLCGLPDKLRAAQTIFGKTGGLHAAGLFSPAGELCALKEDIGRHNAVDKLVGWALLEGLLPLSNHALLASGRGGFEIIQKSLTAGIPLLASVSAASSAAVQMARDFGLSLVGFLRDKRFVVYSGEERLDLAAAACLDPQGTSSGG